MCMSESGLNLFGRFGWGRGDIFLSPFLHNQASQIISFTGSYVKLVRFVKPFGALLFGRAAHVIIGQRINRFTDDLTLFEFALFHTF